MLFGMRDSSGQARRGVLITRRSLFKSNPRNHLSVREKRAGSPPALSFCHGPIVTITDAFAPTLMFDAVTPVPF